VLLSLGIHCDDIEISFSVGYGGYIAKEVGEIDVR
jgi:hypothetical protein